MKCEQCGCETFRGRTCTSCGAYFFGDSVFAVEPTDRHAAPAEVEPVIHRTEPLPESFTTPVTPVEEPPDTASYLEREAQERRVVWLVKWSPVLAVTLWFTTSHILFGNDWVFIDNFNLAVHEAGHILFGWGGDTIAALGGTMNQLLWPLAFAAYFGFKRKEWIASATCIWWYFQNHVAIARYMADAQARVLPLAGGDVHDWWYLFGQKWGVIEHCVEIARVTRWWGYIGMLACTAYIVVSVVAASKKTVLHNASAPP